MKSNRIIVHTVFILLLSIGFAFLSDGAPFAGRMLLNAWICFFGIIYGMVQHHLYINRPDELERNSK